MFDQHAQSPKFLALHKLDMVVYSCHSSNSGGEGRGNQKFKVFPFSISPWAPVSSPYQIIMLDWGGIVSWLCYWCPIWGGKCSSPQEKSHNSWACLCMYAVAHSRVRCTHNRMQTATVYEFPPALGLLLHRASGHIQWPAAEMSTAGVGSRSALTKDRHCHWLLRGASTPSVSCQVCASHLGA